MGSLGTRLKESQHGKKGERDERTAASLISKHQCKAMMPAWHSEQCNRPFLKPEKREKTAVVSVSQGRA